MKKRGFTLIELLVVIAIVGLLSTLAVVALNSARQKGRDAKRVSDIKQVQTALELYFNDNTSYPDLQGGAATAQLGVDFTCLDGAGFGSATDCTTGLTAPLYMGQIPSNPTPNAVGTAYWYYAENSIGGPCSDSSSSACRDYTITFYLEGDAGDLEGPGTFEANSDGIIKL